MSPQDPAYIRKSEVPPPSKDHSCSQDVEQFARNGLECPVLAGIGSQVGALWAPRGGRGTSLECPQHHLFEFFESLSQADQCLIRALGGKKPKTAPVFPAISGTWSGEMNLCSWRISHHRAQKAWARHGESFGPMSAVFELEKMRSSHRKNLEDWLLEHI